MILFNANSQISYHLKEKTIGRLLVKVMKINKDSDDGYALVNWKHPGASKSAGDFALRCYGSTPFTLFFPIQSCLPWLIAVPPSYPH